MLQLTLGSQSDPIKYMEFLFTLHIKMEISRYYYVKVVFAYVAQAVVLHVIPYYLSFIGASFVILSAICTPLEKYVRPKLPERLRLIC